MIGVISYAVFGLGIWLILITAYNKNKLLKRQLILRYSVAIVLIVVSEMILFFWGVLPNG